jgi:hypothetical protein
LARRSPSSTFGELPLVRHGERLDLAREDLVEAVVVGDGREDRGVRRQRDGGDAAAFQRVAAHQLGGNVLRIGGAAAVPEHEQLVPGTQRLLRGFHKRHERLELRLRELELQLGALSQALDDFLHPHLDLR